MVKDAMNATFFPFLSPILDDDERVKKGFITGFSSSTYTVFSLSLSLSLVICSMCHTNDQHDANSEER
tara:strand:- start:769 stop:972 length:204 start_codon:yes stop_codon:yes gene_type:complete